MKKDGLREKPPRKDYHVHMDQRLRKGALRISSPGRGVRGGWGFRARCIT